jgi:beta-glucanase (GH16 family)
MTLTGGPKLPGSDPGAGSRPEADGGTSATPAPQRTRTPLRNVDQRASLRVLPQLAQPGRAAASPGRARSALLASFSPASQGRLVQLQRRDETGWTTVARGRQGARGRVEFTAAFRKAGAFATYRAVAVRHDGLRRIASDARSTERWAAPALDERFDGSAIPTGWARRKTQYDGMRQCAISSSRALRVADGKLRLSVKNDPDRPSRARPKPRCTTKYGSFDWRITGHLSTQGFHAFRYGYAAARMKFQRRAGQHAAFWLQPANSRARSGAEIDVIEWFGQRKNPGTQLSNFVHRGGTKDKTCGLIRNPAAYGRDWWNRYHVFSVEWTRSGYTFRIDGKVTCRTSRFVSHTPQYLILSLQANTYELPLLDGNPKAPHSGARLPQHTYVDWVRYWTL